MFFFCILRLKFLKGRVALGVKFFVPKCHLSSLCPLSLCLLSLCCERGAAAVAARERTWMIASPFGHPPPFQSKKSQPSPSYYLIQKLKIYSTKYFLAISFLYKNDRRNSRGALRQKFNLKDIQHLTFN